VIGAVATVGIIRWMSMSNEEAEEVVRAILWVKESLECAIQRLRDRMDQAFDRMDQRFDRMEELFG
jgi:hypothetical protein